MAADAKYLSDRALPDAPDGYYDWQVTGDEIEKRQGHSTVTNAINRVQAFFRKGGFSTPDPRIVKAFLDSALHPEAVNDRDGAFQKGLDIIAKIDPSVPVWTKLNNAAVNQLYNTIPHPPDSYLGTKYAYRQADGGGNNLENPDLGRAGTPYARSVRGQKGLPKTALPDPGLVFDMILKRSHFKRHEGGMSSMIFAFATLVTHSLFRTRMVNPHKKKDDTEENGSDQAKEDKAKNMDKKEENKESGHMLYNDASSYLDLSPLYGDNLADQLKVRNRSAGLGLLYPDTFHEERLLFLPPAASALLVVFSRNHNYIAEKIFKLNECGKWKHPSTLEKDIKARDAQDEQIFQTAKLINCGHFMSCIMGDYVPGFLGVGEGCNWNLKVFDSIKIKKLTVDRGQGNHCSIEFNILYRWHSTTSREDEKWTEDEFKKHFGNKPLDQLAMEDMYALLPKMEEMKKKEPREREFAGLKRGDGGKFDDEAIANILKDATERPAGSFGARGTPTALRLIEIMGMVQARAWGACTMNEFRRFLGLKEFETFEEWNPDPQIADAARWLYGHIDNLELYTGLQAESTMPLSDGLRFACGYTTTRGVLGDAVALVRGDRFSTIDFSPANYTSWGFKDCQRDLDNGGYGGQLPKLFTRTLPEHYPSNSVYTTYPFFVPSHMKESLTKQKTVDQYTFERPRALSPLKRLDTLAGIETVLGDPTRFKPIYETVGHGSALMMGDVVKNDKYNIKVLQALFPGKNSLSNHTSWLQTELKRQIKEKSRRNNNVPGNYLNIVDAINMTFTHFAVNKITGIPLKTKANPTGLYTEREMCDMLKTLYTSTFLAADDPPATFALHTAASRAKTVIGLLTSKAVMEAAPSTVPSLIGWVVAAASSYISSWVSDEKPNYPFHRALAATRRSLDDIVEDVIGTAVGTSVNHAQAAINVIDFYLDDVGSKDESPKRAAERRERARNLKHIMELARNGDSKSTVILRGYVREAMRLRPQTTGLYLQATADRTVASVEINAGDRVWASLKNAHRYPYNFEDPMKVNPYRKENTYNLFGCGHDGLGTTFVVESITEIVRYIFALPGLRRANGAAGKSNRVTETINETETDFFIQRDGTLGPLTGSMLVVYDG